MWRWRWAIPTTPTSRGPSTAGTDNRRSGSGGSSPRGKRADGWRRSVCLLPSAADRLLPAGEHRVDAGTGRGHLGGPGAGLEIGQLEPVLLLIEEQVDDAVAGLVLPELG